MMKFFQKRSVAAAVLVLAVVAGGFIGQAKKPDTSEAPSTKIVGSYTYTYDYAAYSSSTLFLTLNPKYLVFCNL